MWIRDVDVPTELLAAARAGELVIFVGAGASRDQPSGLPDFRLLTKSIGKMVGQSPTEADLQRPDVYLGGLADNLGIDVHRLISNAIDVPGSSPNALHKAITKLATAHGSPRIVTTNYDRHLTTASEGHGSALPVYEAPALPIGDDFLGIVHLHGSLSQEPRHLVVTDTDFGRAYLLDAWAARFLERMFSAFTVLFIGYSHGDVVMQYLARSLGPSGKRFVCTGEGDDPIWRQYGLTPVSYAVELGEHHALPDFVARWAEISAMGHTQHRTLVSDLVAAGPPTVPEEVSYLEETLEHPERIRYFVEKARGPAWLDWVAGRPVFQSLFDCDRAGTGPAQALVSWVADHYMLNEGLSGLALRAMRERPWPTQIRSIIVHRLFAYEGEMASWIAPWLLIALQHERAGKDDLLDMLLAESNWGDNVGLALALFEDRTVPRLRPAISFRDGDGVRFDVEMPAAEYFLSDAWSKVFLPMLPTRLGEIATSVDEQIARLYRVRDSLDAGFDSVSFGRSAIETHEQDTFRESVDVLIDAARDCVEHALEHDVQFADRLINSWVTRDPALFRRLAVHAWRVRNDRTADQKLRWLEARDWLWDVELQHEVFALIGDALPNAGDDLVRSYVEAAKAGPAPMGEDDEVSPYRSYNLLAWLAQSADDRSYVVSAFEDAQTEHPEYGVREHPDLNTYMTSGFVEDAPLYTVDELHARISEDVTSAVASLRALQTDTFATAGPTWAGAMRSLQACVSQYPGDGLTMASRLGVDDGDFRNAIIRGWDTARVEGDLIDDVLNVIDGWDVGEVRRAAASMLSNGGTQTNPTSWHWSMRSRRTASNLWPTGEASGAISSGDDLLMETINHPAGDLAEFWTKVVQREWTEAGDAWSGLPEDLTTELERMLLSNNHNGVLAGTFLASQLHFYFAADRGWASQWLLPLLVWSDNEEQARGAWQGFLTWGRVDDTLLSAGLLDALVQTTGRIGLTKSRLLHQLSTQLASVALFSAIDPLVWLSDFVVTAPEEVRVSWADQIGRFLNELNDEEACTQWERWIVSYWAARVQSTPLALTKAEASAMARWLIGLTVRREEAVALLVQTPAGLPRSGGFLHRLRKIDVTCDASHWAAAITHLLKGTEGPDFVLSHNLKPIVQQLRLAEPPPDLGPMIDEALRLGATEAADW